MKKYVLLLALLTASQVFAQYSILKSDEDFIYSDFYQIHMDAQARTINLMKFDKINKTFPLPAEPYKRDEHFGGWLRDTTDGSCLNTRGKVLVRDSESNVTFNAGGCTVESGDWNDPYTARLHTEAKDIQIDHVVALKNAYMTGAHEWDYMKRCLYANYMGNNFHLMSVNGPENLKKSDHSPSGYIPPNKKFTCEFVRSWLNIKLIWSLRITPKEGDAIKKIAKDNSCDDQIFEVPAEKLQEQKDFMRDNANLCDPAKVVMTTF